MQHILITGKLKMSCAPSIVKNVSGISYFGLERIPKNDRSSEKDPLGQTA